MVEGVYVGHQARTGSLLIMTPEGVLRAKTFNKMSAEERWKPEIFESLKGRPWDLRPGADRVPRAAAGQSPRNSGSYKFPPPPPMPVAPRAGDPGGGGGGVTGPRKLYVLKRDVVALGATPGCVACERIAAGLAPGVAHTDACTQRMEVAIRADPSERHRVEAQEARAGDGGSAAEGGREPKRVRFALRRGKQPPPTTAGRPAVEPEAAASPAAQAPKTPETDRAGYPEASRELPPGSEERSAGRRRVLRDP